METAAAVNSSLEFDTNVLGGTLYVAINKLQLM